MIPTRHGLPLAQENPLYLSWHDTAWIPILSPTTIMDYFSEKSNPFYDRTCNNEIVKMQRQSLDHLNNMVGVEYILLHVQEPILYVIRKQHRHSSTEATPLADYYIVAGYIYQAPDLASVFNSRLLSTVNHLQVAFEEASSYARYHPGKGYTWDFSSNKALTEKTKKETKKEVPPTKEEPSSLFQRQRVDMLLSELYRKFPLPMPGSHNQASTQSQNSQPTAAKTEERSEVVVKQEPEDAQNGGTENGVANQEQNIDIKSEMKPPPEKKMKI